MLQSPHLPFLSLLMQIFNTKNAEKDDEKDKAARVWKKRRCTSTKINSSH